MTSSASLKTLRRRAPRQDRKLPSLAPSKTPENPKRSSVRFARTLEELRSKCGRYGEAAVLEARWSAVAMWLMKEDPQMSHSYPVASEAVLLCREEARHLTGFPRHDGQPWTVIMHRISEESQDEARRVGTATVQDWEQAGKPWLTEDSIQHVHQSLLSSLRNVGASIS